MDKAIGVPHLELEPTETHPHILVIEDSQEDLRLICRALRRWPPEVDYYDFMSAVQNIASGDNGDPTKYLDLISDQ
jgi:hypothetical protein